jgi:hypothetical protein
MASCWRLPAPVWVVFVNSRSSQPAILEWALEAAVVLLQEAAAHLPLILPWVAVRRLLIRPVVGEAAADKTPWSRN